MKRAPIFVGLFMLAAGLLVVFTGPVHADDPSRDRAQRPSRTSAPTRTRVPTRTAVPTQTRVPTETAVPTWTTPPVATASPLPPSTPAGCSEADPHQCLTAYEGPQTCVACHASEAQSILNSEHMQWAGKWKEVNTYCTAPEPADFACRSCHVSTGKVTNLTVNDVDCLICHNDTYKRALGPQSNIVNVTDWTGATLTYKFPVKVNGDYQFQPRYDLMPAGTTLLSLAQTVHLPTLTTCLNCHAKAGGGDGIKRGDLYMNLASPALSVNDDVHMSPAGANLTCQDCHVPDNHLIPGRGIDLRVSEGGTVTCEQCHSAAPHSAADINRHTARVACQTCHIPHFGKNTPTEMSRDWTSPHWNPAGCNGQGAWIGEEVKAGNVIPTYKFWNGQSDIYNFGESLLPVNGVYNLAQALGTIQDGKLTPLKVHTANQPIHLASQRVVQYDVLWQFMTGKYEEAAARGVAFMGLTGPYTWAATSADQLITHGVEPKSNALRCAACHETRTQMDLRTLGYALKAPASVVCAQCHGPKEPMSFDKLHIKHVTDKHYDCSACHTFSRPERGLQPAPAP